MEQIKNTILFDIDKTIAKKLFEENEYPYQIISKIKDFIIETIPTLDLNDYYFLSDDVIVHKTATVSPKADINGPTIICENAVIRPFAYFRYNVIVGNNCVVGNSTELKNTILFDEVKVPHYDYVGDSIIGYDCNIGAGVRCADFRNDRQNIIINYKDTKIETGLRKLGSMIGDHVNIGCNSVLNPGTIIGRNTTIYPLVNVRGYIEPNKIYKNKNNIVDKKC